MDTEGSPDDPTPYPDAARGQAARQPRILVADDAESIRVVVRITVQSQDWLVIEATTGEEALERARLDRPDLIVLDLDFSAGGPQGLDVLRALAAPETAAIPIIVLSGSDRPTDEADSRSAGAAAFVRKPFGPIALLAVMRSVLDARAGTLAE